MYKIISNKQDKPYYLSFITNENFDGFIGTLTLDSKNETLKKNYSGENKEIVKQLVKQFLASRNELFQIYSFSPLIIFKTIKFSISDNKSPDSIILSGYFGYFRPLYEGYNDEDEFDILIEDSIRKNLASGYLLTLSSKNSNRFTSFDEAKSVWNTSNMGVDHNPVVLTFEKIIEDIDSTDYEKLSQLGTVKMPTLLLHFKTTTGDNKVIDNFIKPSFLISNIKDTHLQILKEINL